MTRVDIISITLVVSIIILSGAFMQGITGLVTGTAQVEVTGVAQISLPTSSVNFGQITPGATNDTTDDNPAPFVIQNDGNVIVNVSIERDPSSTPMFNGTGGGDNTASFQFKADNTTEANSFNWETSTTSWTNVPGTTTTNFLNELGHQKQKDSAEVDLLINVPEDEPAGVKSESLIFTAMQA
ncbi:MAG: hypothetical protein R6U26_01090 [Candidatus Undinarchaeales archaeon]